MRTQLFFAGLFSCFVGAALSAAPAHACSCLASAFSSTDPADGSENVPLNKGLIVAGAYVQESLVLENSAGEPIEHTLFAGPTPGCTGTWAEVVPKQPLAPNMKYTIRVKPIYPGSDPDPGANTVTFTTGTEMLADEELKPPTAKASVILGAPERGGCGSTAAMTCIAIEDRKNVEIVASVGDRVSMRWTIPMQGDLTFGFAEAPTCLEFRRRSVTGKRSAPFKICDKQLGTRQYRESDNEGSWLGCHDGVFGSKPGVAAPPPTTAPADAGSDPDSPAISNPPRNAAGAGATPSEAKSDSSSDAKHEAYGCSAVSGGRSSALQWSVPMFAVWLAARSGKRARRRAHHQDRQE
jgi:hypothetical protein